MPLESPEPAAPATQPEPGDSGPSGVQLARQIGVVVHGRMAASLAELLLPIVLVHVLDKLAVGLLSYLLLLYGTVAAIVATSLPESVLYFLPGLSPGARRATVLRVTGALAALGGLAALVFAAIWAFGSRIVDQPQALLYVPLLVPYALFDLPARALPHVLIAEDRHRASAWLSIGSSAVQLLAVLVPAGLGAPLWMSLAALTAVAAVRLLLHVAAIAVLYARGGRERSPVSFVAMFRYAVPLGLSEIASVLNGRFDRFLIAAVFTQEVFAEYFVGAWQVPLVTLIPYAAGNVLMPRFTERYRAGLGCDAVRLWQQTIEKISLVVLPCALVFLVSSEEIIHLLFGPDYARAAGPFRIYALLTLARVAAYGVMMTAAGLTREVLYAMGLSFAVNVVASVPLVYAIGFLGPAIGTVIAQGAAILYYLWRIAVVSRMRPRHVFPFGAYGRVLGVALLASLPAIAIKLWAGLSPGPALAAESAVLFAAFLLLATRWGLMGRAEWSYLRDWLLLRSLRGHPGNTA